jgi:hypothetical protein
MHGPECPLPDGRLRGVTARSCACVLCHCGDLHEPGGEFGTCLRCLRKRREDLFSMTDELVVGRYGRPLAVWEVKA